MHVATAMAGQADRAGRKLCAMQLGVGILTLCVNTETVKLKEDNRKLEMNVPAGVNELLLKELYGRSREVIKDQCLDVGDSMNEQCWASYSEKVICYRYFFKKVDELVTEL